jgi:hypothetical protein
MDLSNYKRGTFLMVGKELEELPSKLREGENINQIICGQMNSRQGILVLTDIRVFWFAKRTFGGADFAETPISKIGGANVKREGISNILAISFSGGNIEVKVSESKTAAEFAAAISNQPSPSPQIAPHQQTSDLISQLERLAALKSNGILTDEEFAQQKAKILSA